MSSPNSGEDMVRSRAFMLLTLRRRVLISPLCGDEAEGLGEGPGREGVGAVALVHDRQGAREIRVAQVGVEGHELGRHEHALVDDGAARQGGDVEALQAPAGLGRRPLQALAQHVQPALGGLAGPGPRRGRPGTAARTRASRRRACSPRQSGFDRHAPPAEHGALPPGGRPLPPGSRGPLGLVFLAGQEQEARPVAAGLRELDPGHPLEEGVRDLQQDAGPVAGLLVAADRAAVLQVDQDADRVLDDRGATSPVAGWR